jgi:predicted CXXCH cytochrome family protein
MKSSFKLLSLSFMLCTIIFFYWVWYPDCAISNPYLDSSHGNSTYGVDRTSLFTFGYSKGNCVYCHEQHASIGGSEPAPTGGPDKYELFATLFTDQSAMFCFQCHTDTSPQQQTLPVQYNYSRIAGGDTNTCPNDIKEAFQFVNTIGNPQSNCGSSSGSSHFLANIQTFLTNKWNFDSTTANIDPCSGCHNPHRAQRDPHTTTERGWPVSRPSQHNKDNNAWGLWGDDSTERMSNYTYQPPYRVGSATYEPDGDNTSDALRTVDYVEFCTDCHNTTNNTITSTPLGGGYLKTIDWSNEKHGQGFADGSISVKSPYDSTMGKVLSCLDCHEPHGSPNVMLIRKEVNGATLAGITTIAMSTSSAPGGSSDNTELGYLCHRCHYGNNTKADNCYIHHTSSDSPYPGPPGG